MTDAHGIAPHVQAAKELLRQLHEEASTQQVDTTEGEQPAVSQDDNGANALEQLVYGLSVVGSVAHGGPRVPVVDNHPRVDQVANQYAATTKPGRSRTLSVTG